jgi:hypothetical protein
MNDGPGPITVAEQRAAGAAGWCEPRGFAVLLTVLVFAAFARVLLGSETFAVRDFGLFSYPVASFQRDCFWKGELPWWNPYNVCGLPFLAQFNTLSLYPLSLIYLLLPLAWGLPLFCLAHLYLGGLGMYFLARRWTGSNLAGALAGVIFSFNGLSLNFLMWPSHIATFAWMPWVIVLTESAWRGGGRALPAAALAAAMQVLGGGPETILFTWLILAALAALEMFQGTARPLKVARRFVLVGMLALGLAALQWLPFADFVAHSSRSPNYASTEWSMPAWGWANFLAPRFHTYLSQGLAMQHDQYWTGSYYAGIAAVLLSIIAVWRVRDGRVRLLAGLVAVFLVLALGDHGYLYVWLRRLLPFLGMFRFPIKFVILTSALLPLLAAYGLAQYETRPFRGRPEALAVAGLCVALLLIAIFGEAKNAVLPGLFLVLTAGMLVCFAARPAQRRWSGRALLLLCWADLLTAVPWQNPTLNPSVYQPGLGRLSAKLQMEAGAFDSRVMMSSFSAHQLYYFPPPDLKTAYLLDRSVFLADCNLLDGVPKVDGFFSLYLRTTDKILWQLDERRGAELERLEDFLGVSATIAPGKVYAWVPRTNYVPIITCGQEPVFADDTTAFDAIGRTNIDFRRQVFLPVEAKATVTAQPQPASRIVRQQFDNNKVSVTVESPGPVMVSIGQAWYHNWHAFVDGKPVPLWRANYAFQAAEVPAGRHEVKIVFRDRMCGIGTMLMAGAAAACAVLGLVAKEKTKPADVIS